MFKKFRGAFRFLNNKCRLGVFKLSDLINKLIEFINKKYYNILWRAVSIILAVIDGSRKSQTRCEAATESHGSRGRLTEIAGLPGKVARFCFLGGHDHGPIDAPPDQICMVTGFFLCKVLRQRSHLPAPSLTSPATDSPEKAKPGLIRGWKAQVSDSKRSLGCHI
jgi:hypothetical protein